MSLYMSVQALAYIGSPRAGGDEPTIALDGAKSLG